MSTHSTQQAPAQETSWRDTLLQALPDVGAMWEDFSQGFTTADKAVAAQGVMGNAAVQDQVGVCEAPEAATVTVAPGDTLGKIAVRHGRAPGEYVALYEANRDQLASPDAIEVGQVLKLPEAWAASGVEAPGVEAPGEVGLDSTCEMDEAEVEAPEAPSRSTQVGEALGGAWNEVEDASGWAIDKVNDGSEALWTWLFGEDEEVAQAVQQAEVEACEDPFRANPTPPEGAGVQGMSQFIWYSFNVRPLGFDEVQEAMKVLQDTMGLGSLQGTVTQDQFQHLSPGQRRDLNPNQGYWWFKEDGSATWSADSGARALRNVIGGTYLVNDWTTWMSRNPPGDRPGWYQLHDRGVTFSREERPGFKPVDARAQNLDLRNIPGGRSCFATSLSMMAQAGEEPTQSNSISGIVTEEEYSNRKVVSATTNEAAAQKAMRYIEFETSHGRPVFTGVTYTNRNGNSDKITDHWVVIDRKLGDGQYGYKDPGNDQTEETRSADHVFAWSDTLPGLQSQDSEKPYIVSWVRPNTSSMEEWLAHEARQQGGQVAQGG